MKPDKTRDIFLCEVERRNMSVFIQCCSLLNVDVMHKNTFILHDGVIMLPDERNDTTN